MGLKDVVMQLFCARDATRLEQLAELEPGVMRLAVGRLWDPDVDVRTLAARVISRSARAHPDLGRDVVRRLVWALNDEAAINGVYGLLALGEIGARAPDLIAEFVGPIASYAWDDGIRPEILRALARIAAAAPYLVAPHLEALERYVDQNDTEETGQMARLWSLVGEDHGQA